MAMAPADCVCLDLVSVSEYAALASGRYLGKGDTDAAFHATAVAMRQRLDMLRFRARITAGVGEPLETGAQVGAGGDRGEWDLALGALQEGIVARGESGAISVLAATDPGSMLTLPNMYMRKMAVGPVARGLIDLLAPLARTIDAVAEAYGRKPADITAIVLNRPRHEDLIDEIRATGARIKLIQDGDVTAAVSAAIRGTNSHLAVGIGATIEGVIAAAAMRALGGDFQGQLWPVSRTQVREAMALGIEDVERVWSANEIVRGDAIVVATGISSGDLLNGVRYLADAARTQSIVMCSRCRRVDFLDTTHGFSSEYTLEIRV